MPTDYRTAHLDIEERDARRDHEEQLREEAEIRRMMAEDDQQ